MKRRYFGTDGIRGLVNKTPMTTEFLHSLGAAVVKRLREKGIEEPRLVLGRDTRRSGRMLESAFIAGASAMGGSILLAGILPTPAIAFLTRALKADAGVMISASHNPFQDNGIKFFGADGFKLTDEDELEIEALLIQFLKGSPEYVPAHLIGNIEEIEDAEERYLGHLLSQWPESHSLQGKKIVLDAAHGAAYSVAQRLLKKLGAEVFAIGVKPDGVNINEGVGATQPETLAKYLSQVKADLGISLDGDADRLIMIDENGQIVDGDFIMAIAAPSLFKQGRLPHATVVSTVMSNIGLERALAQEGITLIRTQVGDRYVLEKMKEIGATLGGEQSGHLIFLEHATTGDGLSAALQILQILAEEGATLSQLAAKMKRFPQVLRNVRIREKKDWRKIDDIREAVERIENLLGADGRVLVRYSGTENKARVMVEGIDERQIEQFAKEIADKFAEILGA